MPEAAPWKFRKIIKPLFDLQKENILFKCRVIETKSLKVIENGFVEIDKGKICLLYTSPSPRDRTRSRMPSSA